MHVCIGLDTFLQRAAVVNMQDDQLGECVPNLGMVTCVDHTHGCRELERFTVLPLLLPSCGQEVQVWSNRLSSAPKRLATRIVLRHVTQALSGATGRARYTQTVLRDPFNINYVGAMSGAQES